MGSWSDFKNEFGMAFNGEEETTREAVFNQNIAFIEAENANGNSYTLGGTSSLICQMRNSRPSTPEEREAAPSALMMPTWASWKLARLPALSIGPPTRLSSTQSRTRDNAAVAGPSPQWELWRALTPSRQASWEATPSSSWWTAIPPVDPRAATVVSTSTESPTLALPALPPRAATHTLPRMAPAGPALSPRHWLPEPSLVTRAWARTTQLSSRL